MAPSAVKEAEAYTEKSDGHTNGTTELRLEPLKNSGSIDHLEYVDVTQVIGREHTSAKIKEMLTASNSEQQLRDLAITICERGVVFFRAPQDDLTVESRSMSPICSAS